MRERFSSPFAMVGWAVAFAIGVYHVGVVVLAGALLVDRGFAMAGGVPWLLLVGGSLTSTFLAVLAARRSRRIGASWLFGAAAAGALGTYRLEPDLRSLAHGLLLWYGPQFAIGVVLLAGRRAP